MSAEAVAEFLAKEPEERLALVREGEVERELRAYLGDEAWSEYSRLATGLDAHSLAVSIERNLLFAPGIMGTLLQSEGKAGVWWIDARTRQHIDDLGLAPDGTTDRNPGDDIAPAVADPSYEPFLTAVLEHPSLRPKQFGYDWRKLPTLSTDLFARAVSDLYDQNNNRPIHLVGHSMGGLMIRAALMDHGDAIWPKLGRIVFVGTPHYGAPAIAGYLKNHLWGFDLMALLGRYLSRETFRSLWGALSLLPAPRGIYPGTRRGDPEPWAGDRDDPYAHPCVNFDLYDADNWRLELNRADTDQLQRVLDGARDFHERMFEAHGRLTSEQRERMAVVAGVGHKTLFRLAYAKRFFGIWERAEKTTERVPGNRHRDGDGRVPVASAELDGVQVRYVRGVHGGLTNIPAVYESVFAFLTGGAMTLPRTPEDALRSELATTDVSAAPHLDGSHMVLEDLGDQDMWQLESDLAEVARLNEELENGRLPEFNLIRLL